MEPNGNGHAGNAGSSNGNGNGYHWDSQVKVFHHADPAKLADQINEFCRGRFTVGTHETYVPDKKLWVAFVYFKVKA